MTKNHLSNNVYIQRTNHHQQGQKEKKLLKKQSSSINSASNNSTNTESQTFKFVNIKKAKSPNSMTTTGTLTQK